MAAGMGNPYIKLKEKISKEDYEDISGLQRLCLETDRTSLKLELDYKLNRAMAASGDTDSINEFMYYDGDRLIGYIGICRFGGDSMEVNGMVHPGYRRRGVFRKLFSLARDEWEKSGHIGMLLLSDAGSEAGQGFIRSVQAGYDHSEYEMYLRGNMDSSLPESRVVLRKADNSDSGEIVRQNAIYFDSEPGEVAAILPEEEEKCGMLIYMAEVDGRTIGKVHLETGGDVYGIYGLGVLPGYRRSGYGREILNRAVEMLRGTGGREIMLQVAATNRNALNLYKSCGFVETSTMDYYKLSKRGSCCKI
ncbi:MAG TPA: GNAT family N-acetyltransferase [Clostridia bacterium]|nr:GNAT family N-acetyltransferase [Clostridia bacterium]